MAFAEGKGFTGGGLRHMAYRLRKAGVKPPVIRLARVVATPAPVASPSASAAIVVVVGAARVEVHPGAAREVLATVLDALASRGGR